MFLLVFLPSFRHLPGFHKCYRTDRAMMGENKGKRKKKKKGKAIKKRGGGKDLHSHLFADDRDSLRALFVFT